MNGSFFLGIGVLCLIGIVAVLATSTGTRNERTLGNVGFVFDWLWAIPIAFLILAVMGAALQAMATGDPYSNPVAASPEQQQLWETFWAGVFGLEG